MEGAMEYEWGAPTSPGNAAGLAGLTIRGVLGVIERAGELTLGELAAALVIDGDDARRILRQLADAGLVVANGGRVVSETRISLTPRGRERIGPRPRPS
jgi:DNA-binding MarR family transcriptional regulator